MERWIIDVSLKCRSGSKRKSLCNDGYDQKEDYEDEDKIGEADYDDDYDVCDNR